MANNRASMNLSGNSNRASMNLSGNRTSTGLSGNNRASVNLSQQANKRSSTNNRSSMNFGNAIDIDKKVETEDERMKRFEELTRNLRGESSSSESMSTVDASSVNNRRSFTVKVAEKMGLTKRHTVNLATDDLANLAAKLDKSGKRVFKMGVLLKRSDILKKWKQRFFVVREDKVSYFN
jgi:hypothetical protein